MNSVDSEFRKNINNDIRRQYMLFKTICNNNHPISNFGTGNIDTLKIDKIYEHLKEFYNKYYSSNIMKLVVLSNKPIKKIEKLVKKLFSNIKNKNVKLDIFNENIIKYSNNINDDYSYLIELIPINDITQINISWILLKKKEYNDYKPNEYITHILGFEGDGSLSNYLHNKEWITSLNVSYDEFNNKYLNILLNINTTKEGFNNREEIVNITNMYIDNILKKEVNSRIYNEIKNLNNINFEYQNKISEISYTSSLVINMFDYNAKDILFGPYKLVSFNSTIKKEINDLLKSLSKHKTIIFFISNTFNKKTKLVEKWYGSKYNLKINNKFSNKYGKKINFNFPLKNNFIPNMDKLSILNEKNDKHPTLIDGYKYLWYKLDTQFKLPVINISVIIESPNIYEKINNYLNLIIFKNLLDDYLRNILYPA